MPTESGLMTDEEVKASEVKATQETKATIMAADDYKKTEAVEEIKEPLGASKGMSRPTVTEHVSEKTGKTVRQTIVYVNPPDSKGWGAIREIKEEVI